MAGVEVEVGLAHPLLPSFRAQNKPAQTGTRGGRASIYWARSKAVRDFMRVDDGFTPKWGGGLRLVLPLRVQECVWDGESIDIA